MGKHWVQSAQNVTRTNEHGLLVTIPPGEWFQVKNMELKMLLAQGKIETPKGDMQKLFNLSDCGVVLTEGDINIARSHVARGFGDMQVVTGEGLRFSRTLLWDGVTPARIDLMPIGFHLLTTGWQLAVPLYSYGQLARDIGDAQDRERTKEVIHDLRVPVYNTGLMYVRRCSDTKQLMQVWREECHKGNDKNLAFMRALYRVKPAINALPLTWTIK